MKEWLKYFFGTPRRFLGSTVGIGIIISLIHPEIFAQALSKSVGAIVVSLQPLIGPALTVIIVFAGLRMVFFWARKK